MGVKQSGVQAGIFFVGVALPSLALVVGWRMAVGSLTLLPLFLITVVSRLLPTEDGTRSALAGAPHPYAHSASVRRISVYAFFMGVGGAGMTSFLPLYAKQELGFSVTLAGTAAAAVGLMGVVTRIAWSHRTETSGQYWLSLRIMAFCAVASALLVWGASLSRTWLLWPGVLLAGLAVVAWNGVALLAAVSKSGPEGTGRASGLVLSGFFMGLATSPVVIGILIDMTNSYDPGWSLVTGAFAMAAAAVSTKAARGTSA